MKKVLILVVLAISLFSCSKNEDNNLSKINIRLSNVSHFDFKNIVVNTSTGNVSFEDIQSGQLTNYKTFETAYRYAFVQLQIDGNTYTLQPMDYTGEEPLKNGNYTYQINANESLGEYEKLTLTLVVE